MSGPRVIALAALLTLIACAGDDQDEGVVEVEVTATLAVDAADRLTGVIVIDLELPEGEPSRELVLSGIDVGGRPLVVDEIGGLDAFPRTIDGGDVVRVELTLALPLDDTWLPLPVPGCGEPLELPVGVVVLDVGATEAGLGGHLLAATAAPLTTPEAPPFPVTMRRVWDLSGPFDVIAADPSRDDDLLVGSYSRVERVALDGTRRWSTDLLHVALTGLARGGGVDAFVAWADPGTLPCEAEEGAATSPLIVGRLDDAGEVVWCRRLPSDFGRIAVTDGGTVAVATHDASVVPGTRLYRFGPDGASLGALRVEVPPGTLLAFGERLVLGGTDSSSFLGGIAVVDGDDVATLPLDQPLHQMMERADGTIGLVTGSSGPDRAWSAVGPDTLASTDGELLTGELEGWATFVELEGGSLFGLGEAWAGETTPSVLGYELHQDGARRASGALTCEPPQTVPVHGAGSAPLVAFLATGLRLDDTDVAPAGPLRTLVVELGEP